MLKLLFSLAAIKLVVVMIAAVGVAPFSLEALVPASFAQAAGDSGTSTINGGATAAKPSAAQAPEASAPASQSASGQPGAASAQQASANQAAGQAADTPLDWNALRKKEEELTRREQSLKELERELDARLKKMEAMEKSVKDMLESADTKKNERLRHLVDVYANMKAKQAAKALEKLDEDIAVRILSGMRGRQAGEIMSQMDATKTAVLSKALTQLHLPFSN